MALPHVIVDRPDVQANFDALLSPEQPRRVGDPNQPAFQHSWAHYDAPNNRVAEFYKDWFGIVHLDGLIKNGTSGQVAFTLPAGYHPRQHQLVIVGSAGAVGSMIEIDPAGNVYPTTTNNAYIYMSGISFRAAV